MMKKSDKQIRYLSQAVQLEEGVNPAIIHTTMMVISTAIIVFIGWAAFTNINEVAHTAGEITPVGHQQVVQHLEGGILKKIHVHEGDMVRKGDLLVMLDGAGVQDDYQRALNKQTSLKMEEERLRAFSEGRSPDFSNYDKIDNNATKDQRDFFNSMVQARTEEKKIVGEQIEQKRRMITTLRSDLKTAKDNFEITQDLYRRRADLNQKGYVSDVQFLETKQKLNAIEGDMHQIENRISVTQAEINEYQNRMKSLDAQHRDETYERLDTVIAEKSQNSELIEKLRERVVRLEVRSPANGLVKGMNFNTIGAVVQPGETLMNIVPLDEKLVAQVKILPQHIGHLRAGQPVQVKFSSFDFSRYGYIPGVLDQISATTFTGENGERYYQGRIQLEKSYVGKNPDNMVMPGMTVMADIITGKKTILDYLLKPIQIAMKTSFTER